MFACIQNASDDLSYFFLLPLLLRFTDAAGAATATMHGASGNKRIK